LPAKAAGFFFARAKPEMNPPLPDLPFLQQQKDGAVRIEVHVMPNAAKTQTQGLHDGALRVRLHAAPVDGQANQALHAWLAETLGVPKSAVELLRGAAARRKQWRVAAAYAGRAHWRALMPPEG
jgi:uncharacterized protein (TIGR00251 family)